MLPPPPPPSCHIGLNEVGLCPSSLDLDIMQIDEHLPHERICMRPPSVN